MAAQSLGRLFLLGSSEPSMFPRCMLPAWHSRGGESLTFLAESVVRCHRRPRQSFRAVGNLLFPMQAEFRYGPGRPRDVSACANRQNLIVVRFYCILVYYGVYSIVCTKVLVLPPVHVPSAVPYGQENRRDCLRHHQTTSFKNKSYSRTSSIRL